MYSTLYLRTPIHCKARLLTCVLFGLQALIASMQMAPSSPMLQQMAPLLGALLQAQEVRLETVMARVAASSTSGPSVEVTSFKTREFVEILKTTLVEA